MCFSNAKVKGILQVNIFSEKILCIRDGINKRSVVTRRDVLLIAVVYSFTESNTKLPPTDSSRANASITAGTY